jgi:hypothetical protein
LYIPACDGEVKNITMNPRNKEVIITSPGYSHKIPLHPKAKCEWAIMFNKDKYVSFSGRLLKIKIKKLHEIIYTFVCLKNAIWSPVWRRVPYRQSVTYFVKIKLD